MFAECVWGGVVLVEMVQNHFPVKSLGFWKKNKKRRQNYKTRLSNNTNCQYNMRKFDKIRLITLSSQPIFRCCYCLVVFINVVVIISLPWCCPWWCSWFVLFCRHLSLVLSIMLSLMLSFMFSLIRLTMKLSLYLPLGSIQVLYYFIIGSKNGLSKVLIK